MRTPVRSAAGLSSQSAAGARRSSHPAAGTRRKERTQCVPRSRSSAPGRPGCCCPTCCTCAASSRWCSRPAAATTSSTGSAPGVLEQGTVDTLVSSGVGERLLREGLVHHGIELRFGGQGHRIAFEKLVPGRAITVYGQQEVVKDLIAARLAAGGQILFEVADVVPEGIEGPHPEVSFTHRGERRALQADFIAGCDGFHGVCRDAIPPGVLQFFDKEYPFGWLGVLAAVAPSSEELIYSSNDRGFALHSMRSPRGEPVLPAGGPGRGHRGLAGRADLGRARGPAGDRARVEPGHRAGAGEGHHRDAQLRGRADAVRAAVPGRGRGPHRAAHRRQGPEPRGLRRHRADRGARRLVLVAGTRRCSTGTRGPACAGSGGHSTSPGG